MDKYQLKVKLLSKELFDKVKTMRDLGLNPSALVRNYLSDFQLPSDKKEVA